MKQLWIEKNINYDGSQLQSLYAYLNFRILGDSIISWMGPCDVSFDHMVDGEDLLELSPIRSNKMLHFIIEIFDQNLTSGVALQRLFASIVKDEMELLKAIHLKRLGDDLYFGSNKLSVSIATVSPRSAMIHFGINVTNENTPVATAALSDFKIEPVSFAKSIMDRFVSEFESIRQATQKVKWVK